MQHAFEDHHSRTETLPGADDMIPGVLPFMIAQPAVLFLMVLCRQLVMLPLFH